MTTTLQEYSFISDADALEISVLRCTPAGRPRAIIQLVHGMAEHKERYMDFMQYLGELGYLCVLHDHRGHGKSIRREDDLGYMGTTKAADRRYPAAECAAAQGVSVLEDLYVWTQHGLTGGTSLSETLR